jgi:hypothetical protein
VVAKFIPVSTQLESLAGTLHTAEVATAVVESLPRIAVTAKPVSALPPSKPDAFEIVQVT